MNMIRSFSSKMIFIVPFLLLTACYRMPTENDYSVVPTTNNPAVTNERSDNFLPNLGY